MKIESFKKYEPDTMNCLPARPVNENGELPLLVYLHGAGERGITDTALEHLYRHAYRG